MNDPSRPPGRLAAGDPATVTESVRRRGLARPVALTVMTVVVGLLAWTGATGPSAETPAPSVTTPSTSPEVSIENRTVMLAPISAPLLAAEQFVATPGPATLRVLLTSIGGLDAVTLGEAEGAFDLVRFDPLDHDRLLASMRSSYGDADNRLTNELWRIEPDGVDQQLWSPDEPHDFAHFNVDGTITMWVRDGDGTAFAPRTATVLDRTGRHIASSSPVFASRFSASDGSVFALTGDGDYYSNEPAYQELVADGPTRRLLDGGQAFGWIDNPNPELLVAYPRTPDVTTAVWDTASLARLDDHPLSRGSYTRVAISGDGRTAVGVSFDGRLEPIDLGTGRSFEPFGSLDPTGVDQPITLSHDGTTAITVDRSGLVSLWWVGHDEPIATVEADAAQPRWVSEDRGARTASAVARDASRVALRLPARPHVPVRWLVVDTSVDAWIDHACRMAWRPLTPEERIDMGLASTPAACS